MTYIIIDDRKLIIEIDADEEMEDLKEEALDKIVNEEQDSLEYIGDLRVEDLSIEQTSYIYSAYEILRELAGIDIDKLLLYWARAKGFNFELERNIDIQKLQREGYNVISLKNNEENNDEERNNVERVIEEK